MSEKNNTFFGNYIKVLRKKSRFLFCFNYFEKPKKKSRRFFEKNGFFIYKNNLT